MPVGTQATVKTMTPEELKYLEEKVNEVIGQKIPVVCEEKTLAEAQAEAQPKRKPGRPKGSKNKKTLEREAAEAQAEAEKAATAEPKRVHCIPIRGHDPFLGPPDWTGKKVGSRLVDTW